MAVDRHTRMPGHADWEAQREKIKMCLTAFSWQFLGDLFISHIDAEIMLCLGAVRAIAAHRSHSPG